MGQSHHVVSEDMLTLIGDITVSFSTLEHKFQLIASDLISRTDNKLGLIITSELSFQRLRALNVSLYLHKYGEDENHGKFRELISKAAELENKRNGIIHSIWISSGQPGVVVRSKTTAKEKKGLKHFHEEIGLPHLKEFLLNIKTLSHEVYSLRCLLNNTDTQQ